jgi:hypothetical protein
MNAARGGWSARFSAAALVLGGIFFSPCVVAFDHAHDAWNALLQKHVVLLDGGKASRLDYAALAKERAALRGYLDALSRVSETQFGGWSKSEQIAFLLNAYNAFTAEKIMTRYPNLKSIWDFGRFFGNPFRDEFFTLLGGRMSLDGIEHGILRKRYREPRVHYAVNCASIGCPMLREEAYVAGRLEDQLDEQARRFLSDRTRNRVRAGRLEVSKIFEWFREDFEPLDAYLARYAATLADNPAQQGRIAARALPVTFVDYDWALNDSRSSSPR